MALPKAMWRFKNASTVACLAKGSTTSITLPVAGGSTAVAWPSMFPTVMNAKQQVHSGLLDSLAQQVSRSAMFAHHVSHLDAELLGMSVWKARKLQALRAFRLLCIMMLQPLRQAFDGLCRG